MGKSPILFLQGRSGGLDEASAYASEFVRTGHPVLVASYRGYSGNPGRPSEDGLALDGTAFLSSMRSRHPNARIIVLGHSLGAAVAFRLASKDRNTTVVAVGAFDNLRSAAPAFVGGMLPEKFDNALTAALLPDPVFMVRGRYDDVVDEASAMRLLNLSPSGSYLITLDNQGHRPEIAEIEPLLSAIEAAREGSPEQLARMARERRFALFRNDRRSVEPAGKDDR